MLAREMVGLQAESGFRKEKAELLSLVIQYAIGQTPLLTQGQVDLLKILFASALETDPEFFFYADIPSCNVLDTTFHLVEDIS